MYKLATYDKAGSSSSLVKLDFQIFCNVGYVGRASENIEDSRQDVGHQQFVLQEAI